MEDSAVAKSGARTPSAIILEPSRELAQQTHENIVAMKRHLSAPALRSVLLVGGTQPKEAARQLQQGTDIVTGTPGAPLNSCQFIASRMFCSRVEIQVGSGDKHALMVEGLCVKHEKVQHKLQCCLPGGFACWMQCMGV